MLPSLQIRSTLFLLSLLLSHSTFCLAGTIADDPMGFYGMKWGNSLVNHPQLIQIDANKEIVFYGLKDSKPEAWGVPVKSIKFLSLNDQFAQAHIHYQGEKTHEAILDYLESTYGKNSLPPGSMMRGLNQQYFWRGTITEISLTYRGLAEQGFISIQSQILAAGLMNAVSDQLF